MDQVAFRRLLEPKGQSALRSAVAMAPTASSLLACHRQLRKQFPDDLAAAALETAMLRRHAAAKFSRAAAMYFTREGLEQSSGEVISTYRARRFAGMARVGDFCCGIGGDSIGLAGVADVVAVDAGALRLAMAGENIKAYDRGDRVTWIHGSLPGVSLPEVDAAFFDPDRRVDGRRHVRIREYAPSLDAMLARLPARIPLGVKVAPAVSWDELGKYDAEVEFISVEGELKECVLWFGPLRTTRRRATILPSGDSLVADQPAAADESCMPRAYLYDPDPAVVRAGLVADLGGIVDGRPVDPEIAYLTSARLFATPFARCYAIEASMPFHARRLGEQLRAMNAGPVTVTKRGSAVDVNDLVRKWRLTGSVSRHVILTRVLGRPWAMIGTPVEA
jgi:hypothetical protein